MEKIIGWILDHYDRHEALYEYVVFPVAKMIVFVLIVFGTVYAVLHAAAVLGAYSGK